MTDSREQTEQKGGRGARRWAARREREREKERTESEGAAWQGEPGIG